MNKVYVTGDLHFNHGNIIKYENRPWNNVKEMNQALIDNWNSVVDAEYTIYILGDLFFCGLRIAESILKQLKGKKIWIIGNHDILSDKQALSKYFEEILDYKVMFFKEKKLVLFHYPISNWDGIGNGSFHLYGHIHGNSHNLPEGFNRKQSYNVGVDVNHYKPVDLDWILWLMEARNTPENFVPKDTVYCYDENGVCPFWDYLESKGKQNDGVCHYLCTTDYEQNKKNNNKDDGCWMGRSEETGELEILKGSTADLFWEQFPHSLLFDRCKECSINDEED